MNVLIKWTVLNTPEEVAHEACQRVVRIAKAAIQEKGSFNVVLAGGQTPAELYQLLAREDCQWAKWHIWFGDERCLPVSDDARNSTLVWRTLTGKVPIPECQVHIIPAELGPVEAAKQYDLQLEGQEGFDLVLLGMGEDGHTASLFPGNDYPEDAKVVAVVNAPKSPPERVSLNYSTLSNCSHLLFIITGVGKSKAVHQWRSGNGLPVSRVASMVDSEVIVDRGAMGFAEEQNQYTDRSGMNKNP